MNKQLRILILEDDNADAELMKHELQKANFTFTSKCVETREAFQDNLENFAPDLILADYTLPSFDGCSALRIAKEKCPDVPFIFVSGTIGEDFAIESLKSGATDYILKDRLSRLAPAVHRALREVEEKIEYWKAEKALKESELRFRSVVQSANDAIILMDGRGIIVSWNAGAQAMFGYMEKEVLGASIIHIMPERYRDYQQKKQEYVSLVDTPNIIGKTVESYGLRKDGSEFPVEISMATWKTEEGTFYSAIIRDITERKKVEKEKDRLLKAIGNSNDGIIIADEKDQYIYLNEAYAKIYGYPEEELIGETWRKLVPPESIAATELELDRTIHNKNVGMLSGEFPGVRKDGTTIPLEVRGTGLWDGKGSYQGHICIVRDIAARKQTEEKLQLFRSLTDQSNDAIFVSDPETGRILDANEKSCANLGYKREELFNMHVMDFEVNLPDQFSWKEHVEEVQSKGHLILEGRHRRKNGMIFPVEVNVSFIVFEKIGYMLAVVRDITERKQAEAAIQESEERLHQAVAVSQIGIFDHDHRTENIYWSPEQRSIYGWEPEEPVTLPAFLKHVHPEDRERIAEAVRCAHDPAGDGTFDVEHRIVDRNGAIHWLSTRSRTHFEGEGSLRHPVRTVGASADITERKNAEEALKRYQLLSQNARDIILFIRASDGQIIEANQAAVQAYGYERQELAIKNILDLRAPGTRHLAMEQIERANASGVFFETLHSRKDGSIFPVEVSSVGISLGDSRVVLSIIRDITDRKRSEEQIIHSLKEKEILLREIHHRVKNNMQIVSSLLGLQAESIKEEKYLEMFRDSRNRIMSMYIIHEKLYRSRDLEKIEFNEYIRDLANGLLQSHSAEAGKVELNINVGDTSLGIDFAIPCGLIINELITNSLKYAFPDGRKGKISISLHTLDKNMFELLVSDNGVGFPSYVDFRKTESLGLRLVTILAENQLHGEIDLNRTGGTEFTIKFKGVK